MRTVKGSHFLQMDCHTIVLNGVLKAMIEDWGSQNTQNKTEIVHLSLTVIGKVLKEPEIDS